MPTYKDIKCEICIAGNTAKEYGEPQIIGNQITTYILGESGKEFAFVTDFSKGTADRYKWNCYTDGQLQTKYSRSKPYITASVNDKCAIKIKEDGRNVLEQKFAFGEITSVDEKVVGMETRMHLLSSLGSLEVRVWRCKDEGTYVEFALHHGVGAESAESVHEKSLKGKSIALRTVMGESVTTPIRRMFNPELIDPDDRPYAIFTFRYRSLQGLKAEGAITEEEMIAEMTPEQLRRELLRVNTSKRTRDDDDDEVDPRRVKREKPHQREGSGIIDVDALSTYHTSKGPVYINLLDSDDE